MKRNKIVIIILSVLILIVLGIIIGLHIKYSDDKYTVKLNEKEHYEKLEDKLESYVKLFYKQNQNQYPIITNSQKIILRLEILEQYLYPLEEIVGYKGEKCDRKLTYVLRTKKDDKYKYEVNYKCGKDSNYDYKKVNEALLK